MSERSATPLEPLDESPSDRRPSGPVRALAAATPLLVLAITAIAAMGATSSSWSQTIQDGGVSALAALAAAVVAALVCGLLAGLGPGARIPSALAAFFASLPWVVGIAGSRSSLATVQDVATSVDPSMRSVIMVAGFSETLLIKAVGSLAGAAVLGGVALALAIASWAPRARRRAPGIAIGVASGLPVVGAAAWAFISLRAVATVFAGAAGLALLTCAIAGAGAGDDKGGRASSLSAAATVLSFLSLACAALLIPAMVEQGLLEPLARLSPDQWIDTLDARAASLTRAEHVAYLLPLSIAPALSAIPLWAAKQHRPTPASWIAALALVLWVPIPIALDLYGARASHAELEAECGLPWDAVEAFAPLSTGGAGLDGPVDLIVGPDFVVDRLGGRTPIADLDAAGAQTRARLRALMAAPQIEAERDQERAPAWLDEDQPAVAEERASTLVRVAFDAHTTGARATRLVRLIEQQGADGFELVGRAHEREWPSSAPAHWCLLCGGPTSVPVLFADSRLARSGATVEGELNGRGVTFTSSDGVRFSVSIAGRVDPPSEELPPYLHVPFDGNLESLAAGALAMRRVRTTLVIANGPESTDAEAPPVRGAAREVPTGLLSREQILSVVRSRAMQARLCYERALARDPELSGQVIVTFMIAPTGRVERALVSTTTLHDAATETCLMREIETWVFPEHSGDVAGVNIPFTFSPAG